jgi:hypothetical protein
VRHFANRSGNFAKEPQLIKRQSNLNYLIGIGAIVFAFSTGATAALAHDSERISSPEREVQELKLRLANLESSQSTSSNRPKVIATKDGWKSLANWRSLKKGMSTDEVRAVLDEPVKVKASGVFAFWNYSNRGEVTFLKEGLYGWDEPR